MWFYNMFAHEIWLSKFDMQIVNYQMNIIIM